MIRKLWRRLRETREGYTDLILAGLDSTVSGADADALVTGAVEVAAGLWARTLAAARVEGTEALSPRIRHRLGRDLIRQGESVFEIVTTGGRLRLQPVVEWDVQENWTYRLDVATPPGKVMQRNRPREAVLHFQWNQSNREPWRGIGPLASASRLGTLVARAEAKLSEDLNTPSATIVPVPRGRQERRAGRVAEGHRGRRRGRRAGGNDRPGLGGG